MRKRNHERTSTLDEPEGPALQERADDALSRLNVEASCDGAAERSCWRVFSAGGCPLIRGVRSEQNHCPCRRNWAASPPLTPMASIRSMTPSQERLRVRAMATSSRRPGADMAVHRSRNRRGAGPAGHAPPHLSLAFRPAHAEPHALGWLALVVATDGVDHFSW